jgi:hypothetical protein
MSASTRTSSGSLADWTARSIAQHKRISEAVLPLMQNLADDAADANASEPACRALRDTAAAVAIGIRQLFDREERMIYPMLRRLADQTMVRPCQAGVVQAWLRQIVRLQGDLVVQVNELQSLASQRISPTGPCEICHSLVAVVSRLGGEMIRLTESERDGMFRWAIDFENALTAGDRVHET